MFWIGIGHAGTLISAVLYLFRASWRTSIYRAAEAMTIFAVMTAGLFPLIHAGPHVVRLLADAVSQPALPLAELQVAAGVGRLRDLHLPDHQRGVLHRGPGARTSRPCATTRPARRRSSTRCSRSAGRAPTSSGATTAAAYGLLAALATPLVLSVHSVVSWDFAMALVPGWHSTLFAPFFVDGAIFSGFAMVLTLLVPLRTILPAGDATSTMQHFDNLAKVILLTGSIVGYAYVVEYFIAWYGGNPFEREAFWFRAFGNYWWATWTMIICNAFLSQMLWFKQIRRSIPAMFVISLFVNLGMWFERFVIIVVSLSHDI